MSKQGWDTAEFRCGDCGHTFTAASQDEYVGLYSEHKAGQCEFNKDLARSYRIMANFLLAESNGNPRAQVGPIINKLRADAERLDPAGT